jgi:hypothetical protein
MNTKVFVAAAFVVAASFCVPDACSSKDGAWGHDEATSAWFKSLRSPNGIPCCDYVDGVRLEDPEWRENDDGSFDVLARGKWNHVDAEHIVKATNRVGYAILWWPNGMDHPSCFLPGARG